MVEQVIMAVAHFQEKIQARLTVLLPITGAMLRRTLLLRDWQINVKSRLHMPSVLRSLSAFWLKRLVQVKFPKKRLVRLSGRHSISDLSRLSTSCSCDAQSTRKLLRTVILVVMTLILHG